jgi:hypothetical protein
MTVLLHLDRVYGFSILAIVGDLHPILLSAPFATERPADGWTSAWHRWLGIHMTFLPLCVNLSFKLVFSLIFPLMLITTHHFGHVLATWAANIILSYVA